MRALRLIGWVAAVGVVGLGVTAGAVAFAGGDPADRYRLATVGRGDVEQVVSTSGTVDLVDRADVSFVVAGTLAELAVTPGQQVSAGDVLARLDTASLQAAVDAAGSTLASAKADLESAQQAQADVVQSADQSQSQALANGGRTAADGGVAAALDRLAQQQHAVRQAQSAATTAIAAAREALQRQVAACDQAFIPPEDTATPTQPQPTTSTASETATPTAGAAASAASTSVTTADSACSEALAAVQAAQEAAASAQIALQDRITELAGVLENAARIDSETNQPTVPQPEDSASTGPSGGGSSAASIASGQAAVDEAEADLLSAQLSLAQATVTAPISGTVASVDTAVGDAVTAGGTMLILVGPGAAVVDASMPAEHVARLRVGQAVTVTTVGSGQPAEGRVSRIGRLADDSSGSASYPVTVTVDQPPASMPAGSTASLAIVVDRVTDVVTVPTSAVSRGIRTTVTMFTEGQPTVRQVEVGAVGPLLTEIRSGLDPGAQVVLADLDEPLPTGGQQTGPGGGGFPGGGRGFPGAVPGGR